MTTLDSPLRSVQLIPHQWIDLADGCRLAARIWLPDDANHEPVPAVLECHPYRKSDCSAPSDASRHGYVARHGYASVRLDIRGSGDSHGVLHDEYLPEEQADIVEVIAWLAEQPWCNGKVGLFGISWGGFNSLQVAALRPPALGAVISMCASDDRYADDVHYLGGCVIGSEMLSWASTMLAYNARPPDPDVVGDSWRDLWLTRLDADRPLVECWLEHQHRDHYWKQGSVADDPNAIECPVYLVGGWADGYRDAVQRLLTKRRGFTKALVGPWGHTYPHDGVPGPAIGFLQESVRWWDHWLKGADTGLTDEPNVVVWMQDAVPAQTSYDHRPGRWIGSKGWPFGGSPSRRWHLTASGLADEPSGTGSSTTRTPVIAASHPGTWCAAGRPGDFAGDQRPEDGQSLTFTSQPLVDPFALLGNGVATLNLAVDQSQANVVVRLCEVAPDGTSTLITRGVLNMTHRMSHEQPEPLVPGERYAVRVALKAMSYVIPAGHQIRVAVSSGLWPLVWPSARTPELTLWCDGSSIELPQPPDHVRQLEADDLFGPPEAAPVPAVEYPGARRSVRPLETKDPVTGRCTIVMPRGYPVAVHFLESDTTYDDEGLDRFEIDASNPLSATATSERSITMSRDGWKIRVVTNSTMTATESHFQVTNTLDAYDGDVRIASKNWARSIPRSLV